MHSQKNRIFLPLLKLAVKKLLELSYILKKIYVCIPRSFLVINVCNQGKILCSPCIFNIVNYMWSHRVHIHWMYQDFVLLLAWWWLAVAETCCQVLNFADLIHVVSLTVKKLLHNYKYIFYILMYPFYRVTFFYDELFWKSWKYRK
jgi:hypothetical protein